MKMSSLPFSLGSSCPPKRLATFNQDSSKTVQELTRIKIPSTQQNIIAPKLPQADSVDNPILLKRRDAIGLFAFGFGLIDGPKSAAVFAAESATGTGLCELTVAPSGLAFCDKVVGAGPQAVKGQLIKAHYVGKLENGKVFDSSYNRGSPLSFRVGVGEVIQGWDQGILGSDGVPPMLVGGKRSLKLPPELAYGVRGAGCRGGSCIIPPNAVLLFDVEFVGY